MTIMIKIKFYVLMMIYYTKIKINNKISKIKSLNIFIRKYFKLNFIITEKLNI